MTTPTTIKDPSELSRDQLETLVREIQVIFWLDERPSAGADGVETVELFWNPTKEHDHQMLDAIAAYMRKLGIGLAKVGDR